jgi:cytochrome c oxidase cbb3-type subunit 3
MAELIDHADGIQEFDNPPPGWLMLIFYGTILFGIGYAIYYPSWPFWPGTSGWSSTAQYTAQMEQAEEQYAHLQTAAPQVALAPDDANVVALGEKTYAARCAPCHGAAGEGKIGPSMVDDTWLYGGTDADIVTSISDGRPKGMPPWKKVLKPEELVGVASFVRKINRDAVGAK